MESPAIHRRYLGESKESPLNYENQWLDSSQTQSRSSAQSERLCFGHRKPNQRWATDLANINCGIDGWCVFAPVIDCCTREVLGQALEPTGKNRTVERALKEALLSRFGTFHSAPNGMLLRHDNGLVFGSRNFRAVVKDYGLTQEYITPYTPKQNGLCERFIKTFKEEFCWCNRFKSVAEARLALRAWIHSYNTKQPHQALKYNTPYQQNQKLCKAA